MKYFLLLFLLFISVGQIKAQSGVLIPLPKNKPDEKILSIQSMEINICIDNQTANVKVMQIYENHTAQTLEGKYVFALPEQASVSDFAVWDGATRIPGVMMEKRRANEIYGAIKQQQIDPGILQKDDESNGKTVFSAKVFPIPPFGTKRIEIEYTQTLAIENFSSHLTFPLKPSFGAAQQVSEFSINLCAYNEFPFSAINFDSTSFPLQISRQTENEFAAGFHAENLILNTDFSLDYQLKVPNSLLSFIAFRAPETISTYDLRNPNLAVQNPDGYFELRAIFNEHTNEQNLPPRSIIFLVDTSLSMYGEKLSKAVESADFLLHNLNPQDEFNLILFGNEPNIYSPTPLHASPENIENALDFLKNSNLGGGTNLEKSLEKSLEIATQFSAGEKNIVLISDANPTLETVNINTILQLFDNPKTIVKLYALGIGSDANTTLLNEIAKKTNGFYQQIRETEDISLLLQTFLSKIGGQTIENLRFSSDFADNFYQVYATGKHSFDGSSFSFVGRYKQPKKETVLNLQAQFGANAINLSNSVELPEFADFHEHLPRIWARERIDSLVREMDLDGEREDYISEIIGLSQKYKLVSPYTAFIAAPRALLRPRLIQPGDPVIRVKTDESIKQVFAVLPFGETLPLKFLESEGVWETRFLAPSWMTDGIYNCRLLLTDKDGNGFEETKTFVVDSNAPKLKINLLKTTFQTGDEIELRVSADQDTAKLTAKLYGAKPVQLFWSDAEKTNIGKIIVPANLASGKYFLTVSAEDFAHNQSSEEVRLEISGN
ncbi:MAG: VIT and VWA domain-containing protein [Actinomycetota bacterium]